MGRLYIPVGILGSGKSSWAEGMAVRNSQIKIVCLDDIQTTLNGTYHYAQELGTTINDMAKKRIRNFLQRGFDIIVDYYNLTKNCRQEWINVASPKHEIIIVLFPNRKKNWHVDNVMKTEKGKLFERKYWESIYDSHKKQLEPVDERMFGEVFHMQQWEGMG